MLLKHIRSQINSIVIHVCVCVNLEFYNFIFTTNDDIKPRSQLYSYRISGLILFFFVLRRAKRKHYLIVIHGKNDNTSWVRKIISALAVAFSPGIKQSGRKEIVGWSLPSWCAREFTLYCATRIHNKRTWSSTFRSLGSSFGERNVTQGIVAQAKRTSPLKFHDHLAPRVARKKKIESINPANASSSSSFSFPSRYVPFETSRVKSGYVLRLVSYAATSFAKNDEI